MNKKEVQTIDDLEQYYKKARKIKFDDGLKPLNIKEIYNYISVAKAEATYYKNGNEHCDYNRMRSIDDYIRLCQHYFPETHISEIIQLIYDNMLIPDTSGRLKVMEYCPNIRKDNFRSAYYQSRQNITDNFNERTFKSQGFPNCNIKYSELIS